MYGHRKLLVYALNYLLRENLISLSKVEDQESNADESGHVITDLLGENTVISWSNIGHQEARLTVWWKYNHSQHPQANREPPYKEEFKTSAPLAKRASYRKFVGVTVSCWIERKSGPHIQGSGKNYLFDIYTREGEQMVLDALPSPKPDGFAAEGKFYM